VTCLAAPSRLGGKRRARWGLENWVVRNGATSFATPRLTLPAADEGALLDDCGHCLPAVGVMALLEHGYGTAIPRARLPFIQYVLLYGPKTLVGIECMHALPSCLCRDKAVMPWVGFKAWLVRYVVCPRRGRQTAMRTHHVLSRHHVPRH
jgi:hypothetical protein